MVEEGLRAGLAEREHLPLELPTEASGLSSSVPRLQIKISIQVSVPHAAYEDASQSSLIEIFLLQNKKAAVGSSEGESMMDDVFLILYDNDKQYNNQSVFEWYGPAQFARHSSARFRGYHFPRAAP